ncbi:MAG TPA: cytochrome b/b6 domain-containing protein [Candidatus Binatia bacterium]|nr:cytochrome b/b6 domain-containing protein [Candidatus Binatia bacterium]
MEKLVYRHNRITRATHWMNALVLVILVMSGFQIFNAHPHLYWGSTSEPDEAFLSIAAANEDGEVRGFFRIYGWQVDTTGVLGVQNTELGPAPRAFPSWLTIPGYFWLAGGRRWHFFFAWIFALNGLLYVIYNIANGHLRKFLLTSKDVARIPAMVLYYFRIRKESPQEGEYNPLQKMAYTSVFLILTPLIMLSGMAMSPQLDTAFHWLPAMFGGRQSARSIHFILTFLFIGFTFGHVCMVLMTGILNNMRSMVSGWYKKEVSDVPEPLSLQTFKEQMIQKPSGVPASRQLPEAKLEELSEETNQPPADAAQQDNGISKAATKDEQLGPENSTQTATTHTHEAKKDIAE